MLAICLTPGGPRWTTEGIRLGDKALPGGGIAGVPNAARAAATAAAVTAGGGAPAAAAVVAALAAVPKGPTGDNAHCIKGRGKIGQSG